MRAQKRRPWHNVKPSDLTKREQKSHLEWLRRELVMCRSAASRCELLVLINDKKPPRERSVAARARNVERIRTYQKKAAALLYRIGLFVNQRQPLPPRRS